jgi:hypothetical protein
MSALRVKIGSRRSPVKVTRLTHLGHRPETHVAVAKPLPAPIKVLVWAYTMLPPELEADMLRREFLGVISGAAATWPLVARAQHYHRPGQVNAAGRSCLGRRYATCKCSYLPASPVRYRSTSSLVGRRRRESLRYCRATLT